MPMCPKWTTSERVAHHAFPLVYVGRHPRTVLELPVETRPLVVAGRSPMPTPVEGWLSVWSEQEETLNQASLSDRGVASGTGMGVGGGSECCMSGAASRIGRPARRRAVA